eukprot:1146185-Pelagomonas_calceolata.AAC.2
MREFVVDLRKRLRGVWSADGLAELGEHTNKRQTNETFSLISKLMDIFCVAGTVEQADQPNYWLACQAESVTHTY